MEDITKTGPVGLKGLKGVNSKQTVAQQYIKNFNTRYGNNKLLSPNSVNQQYSASPTEEAGLKLANLKYGDSIYDEGSAEGNLAELGDMRAMEQPWYAKIGAGLAKGAILAGTTFLDGTVGLIVGGATAFHEGRVSGIWDNDFSKAMQAVNEASEQALPNYYTQDELDKPWYENFFTANFLGDKFIKNLGFTIGAFYSGDVWATGLKLTKLPELIGAIAKSSKAPNMVNSAVGSVISAVNEGRIEALNNSKDWFEANKVLLDDAHIKKLKDIQAEYEANAGKQLVRNGNGEGNSFVDPAYVKYQQALAIEKGAYNKALGKLSEDRLKMGNLDLLMNIPILTASNIIQFGKLYANGFNTAKKGLNIVGRVGEYAAGSTKKGAAIAMTKSALSEGTEEIAQNAASRISGDYYATDVNNFYKSKSDPKAEQETLSFIKSFAKGINETVNDGSAWEEFSIGFLTGALGILRFRGIRNEQGNIQSPITIEGGAINQLRKYNENMARENEIANQLNNRVNSPEFKNYYQGLIRHNKYQNDMNKAAENDDEFNFKNAEHAQLVSDIAMFDRAGKTKDLTDLINAAFDTSDENLESIVKNTTATLEDGSKVGPFVDKNGNSMLDTQEGKQKMIEKLKQSHDEMLKTINDYREIKNELDNKTNQQLSDDQLEELTWMESQINNWAERGTTMSGEVKSAIGSVIGSLSSLLRFNQQVRNYEGQTNKGLTETYLQADKNVNSIQKFIDNLEMVRNQDDSTMVHILSTNPEFVKSLISEINEVDETILNEDKKKDIITKLNDIIKLGNASKTYNEKLKEYLQDSQKQAEDHVKADEEAAKQEADRKTNTLKDKLNAAKNMTEFRAAIEEEENIEAINKALSSMEDEDNEMAKNYIETSQYNNEVRKVLNEMDVEPQVKQDAMNLFQAHFDNSDDLKSVANINSVHINNENAFDEDSGGDVELSATRFQEAQYALQSAMSRVNNDNKFKDRFPKEYKKPIEVVRETTEKDGVKTTKYRKKKGDKLVNGTGLSINKEDIPESELESVEDMLDDMGDTAKFELLELREKDGKYAGTVRINGLIDGAPVLEKFEFIFDKNPDKLRGDDRTTTGDSGTATTPIVTGASKALPTEKSPVGNITKEMVAEENKKANEKADTPPKPQRGTTNQYYRPAIPELHIEASKQGDFRPFDIVVREKERGVDFSEIYNYLRDHNAFEYVNQGNLKVGSELGFMIDPEYEKRVEGQSWHTQPTIFIIDKKNGQVIGSLDEGGSVNNFEGLAGLEERIRKEYAQRGTQTQQRQFKTDYQYDKEMSFYGGQIHGTLDRVENGTAIYVDSKGQPVILLAGKSDHQFIGIFREPNSNRWSIKMENKEGDKTIFRDMMSSVMAQLPLGAKIYERTSISVDGLRVFAQQLKHGFKIGNETYETDINGGDLANIFGLSKEDQEAMSKVHMSEKELPKVKEILKPYLEKLGVKNIDKVVSLTNGNILSVKLPILVKTRQDTGTQASKDDLIHITKTSQGYSHLGELQEWSSNAGDVRQNPDGFGTHNGLYYYKESISGRGGDNITIWFRTEPSQKVKDSIEQLLSESNNLNEVGNKIATLIKNTQSKGKFIATPTTKVSKIMVGRVPYSNTERSLKDIPNVSSDNKKPIFGIIKNGVLTTNGKIDDNLIIKPVDMGQKEGRLYLLIPNGAGKYSPAAVRVKHFNNTEFSLDDVTVSSTPIGEDIKGAIEKLSNASSQDDVSAAMQELSQDLHMQDVIVSWFDGGAGSGIVISRKVKKPDGTYEKIIIGGKEQIKEEKHDVYFSTSKKSAEVGGINWDITAAESQGDTSAFGAAKDPSSIYKEILDIITGFNLPLQVSVRRINDGAYNNRLINSDILTSNITDATVRSSWFTTDYFDSEGNLHKANNPASVIPQPKRKVETPVGGTEGAIAGTRIVSAYSNKAYYVDLKTNTIRDEQGKSVQITNENKILFDLAWAQDNFGNATVSSMMIDNKVLTPEGRVLDRGKQKYLEDKEAQDVKDAIAGRKKEREDRVADSKKVISEIYENQKRVDKDRTDGEFYYILEDDGQYHEYSRVHSRLGSNWIESSKQTESLTHVRVILSKFTDNLAQFNNYLKFLENKYKISLNEYVNKTDVKSRDTIVNIVRDAMSGTNSQRALNAGTAVDSIIRQYFTLRDISKIERPSNMSESAFIDLITTLNNIKSNMEQMGERFLADNIVLFQKYADGTRVAGEVDILSVDKDGNFRIYDVKTSRYSFHDFVDRYGNRVNYFDNKSNTQRISNKDYYTLQLSAYKNLFESQYGVPVTRLAVMPFVLSYNGDNISAIKNEKGIPITYNPAVNVPLASAVKVGKPAETPATQAQAQVVLPIFETSLETQNPIEDLTPEHKSTDEDKVGYFEIDGKLHKGYIIPLTTINGIEIYMTKVPNITRGFGRQGEVAHVASNSFYAVFPNGKTFLSVINNPVQGGMSQSQVEDTIKKNLEGNPQKVKEFSLEKTMLFNPEETPTVDSTPVAAEETPATIHNTPTQSGAKYTAQREAMAKPKNSKFQRKLKLREANSEAVKWDQEKELAWLNKVLPQLSVDTRKRIVKGLIRVADRGTVAWGQFDGSVITLSDIAAEGTTYHEAFHAVFNLLLSDAERVSLLNEYRVKHSNMNDLQLEEELAEDFREFVMQGGKDTRSLGRKILDFFKSLFIKTKYWKDFRPSSIYYFRAINEGKYSNANIKIPTIKEVRKARYREISREDISKALDDEYNKAVKKVRELNNNHRYNTENDAMAAFNRSGIRRELFYRITRRGANNAIGHKIQLLTKEQFNEYKESMIEKEEILSKRGREQENWYFESLDPDTQMALLNKKWTIEKFNSISQKERDHAIACIAF